jgi:hypothetical protein
MVLDGTLANMKVGGNVFAGMAGQHHLHDYVLPVGKSGEMLVGSFAESEHLFE